MYTPVAMHQRVTLLCKVFAATITLNSANFNIETGHL